MISTFMLYNYFNWSWATIVCVFGTGNMKFSKASVPDKICFAKLTCLNRCLASRPILILITRQPLNKAARTAAEHPQAIDMPGKGPRRVFGLPLGGRVANAHYDGRPQLSILAHCELQSRSPPKAHLVPSYLENLILFDKSRRDLYRHDGGGLLRRGAGWNREGAGSCRRSREEAGSSGCKRAGAGSCGRSREGASRCRRRPGYCRKGTSRRISGESAQEAGGCGGCGEGAGRRCGKICIGRCFK